MKSLKVRSICLWISLLLLSVSPALAHGYLVRAIPGDGAVLDRAPTRVQYWFSESLEAAFSSVTVRNAAGEVVATGGVPPDNGALLTARLPAGLPDGAYLVDLRLAFASDGHVVAETRVFFIGQATGAAGAGANPYADPLEVGWRALLFSGLFLLFGTFTLYNGVLLPAWGNAAHAAGHLPPRVMARLDALVVTALALALAGSALALLQQTMSFFATDALNALRSLNVVRSGTRFGEVWTARVLALALCVAIWGASVWARREQPGMVRAFWAAALWAGALALGTLSAASHAAGSPLMPWVALTVDWLHTLGVGFWAGGAAALALVLPTALGPLVSEARRGALLAAMGRFSRLAVASVGVVVATGVYSAANWLYAPADAVETSYGGALVVKLALVGVLLALGLVHHAAVHPGRFRWLDGMARRVQGFVPTLRLEALVAGLVLASAGVLSGTPVPAPPSAPQPPALTAAQTVGDLAVTVTLSPGGPGVNTFDTVLMRGGQPVEGAEVRVRFAYPAGDRRSVWHPAEGAEAGLYALASADIDRSGTWWALVEVDGQRLAFGWDVRAEAAVRQTRDPSPVNWAALALVAASVGYALYPLAQRTARALHWSAANVAAAGGAIAGTVVFLWVGAVYLQDSQARYAATLNPLPQVVNPALPDGESLARGQAAFAQACVGWSPDARDFGYLQRDLTTLRDETLFAAVRDGWRGLPACTLADDAARWDVVNYLRTLER